jgi:hypothetical protein
LPGTECPYIALTRSPFISNRVALFKDDALIGIFDNEHAAIEHGAGMFGLSPFLVRSVQVQQESLKIPALALGVTLGNPSLCPDHIKHPTAPSAS